MLEWVVRMEYKFTIPGRLDGLNEYTAANRTNPHKGGHMKQKNEDGIIWQIRRQLPGIGTITAPVLIYYRFSRKTGAGITTIFCPARPSLCRTA